MSTGGGDVRDPGRSSGPVRRRPTWRAAVVALVVTMLWALVPAACATRGDTAEVGNIGWGALDDDSPGAQVADAPGPQVMSEVTLPDGAVPSVPQAQVPPGASPTTTPPPTAPAAPAPAVLAAPSGTGDGPTPSVALPPSVPGGARAMERLGSDSARKVASQALGRIRFDWKAQLPGWQIRFLPGRAGLRGSTFPDQHVIEVYVRSDDRPDGLSHVIAHEMGHAVDVSRLGPVQHELWMRARGIPDSVPWFPGASSARDYATGAGDWAESFASWQSGVGWYSELGPPPDAVQVALMAQLAGLG